MISGSVKFWHPSRGFGFLFRDDGQPSVFVHISALPEGVEELTQGQRVEFDIAVDPNSGKPRAYNLRLT